MFRWLTIGSSASRATVMFDKSFCAGIAAAIFLLLGIQAVPAALDPLSGVLNGPATLDEIYDANGQFRREACHEIECLAMNDIARSFEILGNRDTPGGPSLLNPQLFNPADYNDKVWRLLAAHRDRTRAYCRILSKVARNYDAKSDSNVARWAIEIAALISPDCARAVVAVVPHTMLGDEMLADAREECLTGPDPGCQFMVRPSEPGRSRRPQPSR